jgi:SAM-dependent methyltransferase
MPATSMMLTGMQPVIASIKAAERILMPEADRLRTPPSERAILRFKENNNPVYMSTPAEVTLQHLTALDKKGVLPKNINAADLGAGLGEFCIALEEFAKHSPRIKSCRVTGFEAHKDYCEAAKKIRSTHGIENVSFINLDFFNVDLEEFNLIFIFKPFEKDFHPNMAETLDKTKKGTIVIIHFVDRMEGFNRNHFEVVYPPFIKDPLEVNFGQFGACIRI